jgi:squalene cyclase
LLSRPGKESGLIGNHGGRLYSHAFATETLALVLARGPDEPVRERLLRAVDLLTKSQTRSGGWAYLPMSETAPDITITATVVRALEAARAVKVLVPEIVLRRARTYAARLRVMRATPRYVSDRVLDAFAYDGIKQTRVTYATTACGAAILASDAAAHRRAIRAAVLKLVNHEPWHPRRKETVFLWFGRLMAQPAVDAAPGAAVRKRHRERMRTWLKTRQALNGRWHLRSAGPGPAFTTAVACRIWLGS